MQKFIIGLLYISDFFLFPHCNSINISNNILQIDSNSFSKEFCDICSQLLMSFSAKYVYMLSYRLTVVYTVVPENGFMKTEVVSFWCHFQRLFSSMWWLYTKYDRWQVIPWRIWRLLLHKTELIFWVRQFYCFSDMGVLIAPMPVCLGFLFTEKSWSRKIMKCFIQYAQIIYNDPWWIFLCARLMPAFAMKILFICLK